MNRNNFSLDPETKKFRDEEGEADVVEPKSEEVRELEPGEEPSEEEEEGYCAQIRGLFAEGYSGKAIIQMGYSKSTVIQEGRKFFKKNNGTIMGGKKDGNGNGLPILPVKLGKGDSIPIETELQHIVIDGDDKYKSGYLDGMRTLIIGARLNQMLIAGLSETTASQLALLKEAKSDSKEVAQETVLEVLPHFAEMMKEAARASSPNPMQSMFARMLEGPMTQAMSGMLSMFNAPQTGQEQPQQSGLPPGWTRNEAAKE